MFAKRVFKSLIVMSFLAMPVSAMALDICYIGHWEMVKPTATNGESSNAGFFIDWTPDNFKAVIQWFDTGMNEAGTKASTPWTHLVLARGRSVQPLFGPYEPVMEMNINRAVQLNPIWEDYDSEQVQIGVANLYGFVERPNELVLGWELFPEFCEGTCHGEFTFKKVYGTMRVDCLDPVRQ